MNRHGNWSSQYSFRTNNGKQFLSSNKNNKFGIKMESQRKKPKIKKFQKRNYTDPKAEIAIDSLINNFLSTGAFNTLIENCFNYSKENLSSKSKLQCRILRVFSFFLFRFRTFLLSNKTLSDWKLDLENISIAINPNFVYSVVEYLEELKSRKAIKSCSMKWGRFFYPIYALREITHVLYFGMKISKILNETSIERYSAVSKIYFRNFEIFKILSFLLKEYSEHRNSKEYFCTLIELTNFTIVLGKISSDILNDKIAIEETFNPKEDSFQQEEIPILSLENSEEKRSLKLSEIFEKIPKPELVNGKRFGSLLKQLSHHKTIKNYMKLLKQHKTNSVKTNTLIEHFFQTVFNGLEIKAIFYQYEYLQTFSQILSDRSRDFFKAISKQIVESFFADVEKYPYLLIDSLFCISRVLAENVENGTYGEKSGFREEINYAPLNEADEPFDPFKGFKNDISKKDISKNDISKKDHSFSQLEKLSESFESNGSEEFEFE